LFEIDIDAELTRRDVRRKRAGAGRKIKLHNRNTPGRLWWSPTISADAPFIDGGGRPATAPVELS
jgi:hypothetical protein